MKYTRRIALVAAGAVAGTLAVARVSAQEMPAGKTRDVRTSLQLARTYHVGAQRVYDVLLSSSAFAALSQAPANIDPVAGGAFSLFGGLIVGRTVELVPRTRIVQAWRSEKAWDPGRYSIVEFEMAENSGDTVLTLHHTGFPEGTYEHLYSGWREHYFDNLTTYLKPSG